ncbi:MAG: hypothetical protein EON87_08640, partial [Brevundimonas sp.]
MANPIKGEVPFTVESGDLAGDYVLLLDFNALCDLEQDFPGLMDGQFEVKSPSAIRTVFAIGLREHHGEMDERDVGRIIHAVGMSEAGRLVGEGFKAAFPEAAQGKASPRKAPAKAGAG